VSADLHVADTSCRKSRFGVDDFVWSPSRGECFGLRSCPRASRQHSEAESRCPIPSPDILRWRATLEGRTRFAQPRRTAAGDPRVPRRLSGEGRPGRNPGMISRDCPPDDPANACKEGPGTDNSRYPDDDPRCAGEFSNLGFWILGSGAVALMPHAAPFRRSSKVCAIDRWSGRKTIQATSEAGEIDAHSPRTTTRAAASRLSRSASGRGLTSPRGITHTERLAVI
jgi:hypothetical protein